MTKICQVEESSMLPFLLALFWIFLISIFPDPMTYSMNRIGLIITFSLASVGGVLELSPEFLISKSGTMFILGPPLPPFVLDLISLILRPLKAPDFILGLFDCYDWSEGFESWGGGL